MQSSFTPTLDTKPRLQDTVLTAPAHLSIQQLKRYVILKLQQLVPAAHLTVNDIDLFITKGA